MRLYFGRIAPIEPQKEQVNGEGWAWRYKVRIFDKHPAEKELLPDEDLPWAQVLLPVTAGSGAANYAVTPSINQGDTVSIAYYDKDEEMPIITGILPRTFIVSQSEPDESGGYTPHTGFNDNKKKSKYTVDDESNESNRTSQPSTRSDRFSPVIGDTLVLADTCTPDSYKFNAIAAELGNLFNQAQQFAGDASYLESVISGTIDRVHSLVNPIVGEMFNNIFESLVPVLNAGLSALFKAVYAKVLAATGNPVAAQAAAEAALIALKPAILALQEAILLVANQIVSDLLSKVDALVRDTVSTNETFSGCGREQFVAALVNSVISEIDSGLQPLLNAVSIILSGGFQIVDAVRGSIDIISDIAGGLLSLGQTDNGKCGGLIREYAYGAGPKSDVGDILDKILDTANLGRSIADSVSDLLSDVDGLSDEATASLKETFGDFPFISEASDFPSDLQNCSLEPPEECLAPEVFIFGGRGEGATATALVGEFVNATDERVERGIQGGIVAIDIEDGGSGYVYPPFVEVRDNCSLGSGCVAYSVIKDGSVDRIYITNPGSGYPTSGTDEFVVDRVEIINGGINYTPGIYEDEFGGEYEVVVGDDGIVIDIIPINIITVPSIPIINIPTINPPIPPGGIINEDNEVVDGGGTIIGPVTIGEGLIYNPILTLMPTEEQLRLAAEALSTSPDGSPVSGNISPSILRRIGQGEIVQVIDCPD